MWTPENPEDFSRFEPADMPAFLDWFERGYTDALALGVADAFIEGMAQNYLEAISQGQPVPVWVETLLRYRLAAQWSYQLGVPLGNRMARNLAAIIPDGQAPDYAARFRLTPQDIADIPPPIRQAFIEGASFSMSWVKRLSDDARSLMGDLISVEVLKNRSPMDAVPLLENILRRELVAKELGLSPEQVTPEDISRWILSAEFKVLEKLAFRAKMISHTEQMRMMNLGILTTLEQDGEKYAYVMPHSNSCEHCRRLIDGRVFLISVLKENQFYNIGRKAKDWRAAAPQHPQCRHSFMRVPVRFRAGVARVEIPKEGLVLEFFGLPGRLEAMESLGLVKPEEGWLLPQGLVA